MKVMFSYTYANQELQVEADVDLGRAPQDTPIPGWPGPADPGDPPSVLELYAFDETWQDIADELPDNVIETMQQIAVETAMEMEENT